MKNVKVTQVSAMLVALAACGVLLLCSPGCNTVEGAGKDLESAGEAIQDAAK